MKKKYTIVWSMTKIVNGEVLYRILALRDIGDNIKKGTYGGYVKGYSSLSQDGDCWIGKNACVGGFSSVSGNAQILDHAYIGGYVSISGNVIMNGNVKVIGHINVSGYVWIHDDAVITGVAIIEGDSYWQIPKELIAYSDTIKKRGIEIGGCAIIDGNGSGVKIRDYAKIINRAEIRDEAEISGNALVSQKAKVVEKAKVRDSVEISGRTIIGQSAEIGGNIRFYSCDNKITVSITNYDNLDIGSKNTRNTTNKAR